MTRRPSHQTIAVLHALAKDPEQWRYGYELGQQVGLKAGTLYPILMRLHERGLLESSWQGSSDGGRPPRHLYRLTGEGVQAATQSSVQESTPSAADGRSDRGSRHRAWRPAREGLS